MSDYHVFTSPRTTEPDGPSLLANLKALDATAGVQHTPFTPAYVIKKETAWAAPHIAAAQAVIDAAPAASAHLTATSTIDRWPLELKAAFLLVMEQMNVVRAALPTPLPPFTVAQFLAAIKAKASTL